MQQQQENERQRYERLMDVLSKAVRARRDGYFTDEDIADMTLEFGLVTRCKHIHKEAPK